MLVARSDAILKQPGQGVISPTKPERPFRQLLVDAV